VEASLSYLNALIRLVQNLNYVAKEENEVISVWDQIAKHPNLEEWKRQHEDEWFLEKGVVSALEYLAKFNT